MKQEDKKVGRLGGEIFWPVGTLITFGENFKLDFYGRNIVFN